MIDPKNAASISAGKLEDYKVELQDYEYGDRYVTLEHRPRVEYLRL